MDNGPTEYKFGLVCISMDMQDQGFKFQTMTRKRFFDLCSKFDRKCAKEVLLDKIVNNLIVTEKTIRHCAAKGIAAYRFSSDLFPLVTDPMVSPFDERELNYDEQLVFWMNKIKTAVGETGVRISLHPDQWNVLASLDPITVERTIKQLNFFGWMMDKCGALRTHWNPINLHVGLSGKDPAELPAIAKRFLEAFEKLDVSVKSRLTLECDDKGLWTCENLIRHFSGFVPLCYDAHHDAVNQSESLCANDAFQLFAFTWDLRKISPLFHYSESIIGEKNLRAHSDYLTKLPPLYGRTDIYYDIEAKVKDKAIYDLMQKVLNLS